MELEVQPIIPQRTMSEIIGAVSMETPTSEMGGTSVGGRFIGATFEGGSFRTANSGARVEIFPAGEPTIGIVVYDDAAAEVFKTIISGTDVGDVIFGDSASNYLKWDKSVPSLTLHGAGVSNPTITGLQAGSEIAIQGWTSTLVFTADDANTVSWSASNDETITLLDGTVYTITAGNTTDMDASTYIYLDIATSTTALQVTQTATDSVGSGKILVAWAKNSTNEALFQVFGGAGGIKIPATDLENLTITASQIASNAVEEAKIATDAVTAAKIAVSGLDGTTGDVAADHIVANMLQTNCVTSIKIQADAVTATKINVVGLDGESGRIVVADQTDADEVTGGINTHAVTLIGAGKVLISGETILSDWSHGTDATYIDGGSVYTASITTTQIAATTIVAGNIAANTITANEIAGNTITANEIAANTITAAKMNVSTLSAITANLGTITAGTITLPTTGWIKGGQTDYSIGTGFWLGAHSKSYILHEDWDALGGWVDGDVVGGVSEIDPAGQLYLDCRALTGSGGYAKRSDVVPIGAGDHWIEIRFKIDVSDDSGLNLMIDGATHGLNVYIGNPAAGIGNGITVYSGAAHVLAIAKTWDTEWHTVIFHVHNNQDDVDIWVDKDPATEDADATDVTKEADISEDGRIWIRGFGSIAGNG